jgi:predicted Holliday junction resolvase-like endonuclease
MLEVILGLLLLLALGWAAYLWVEVRHLTITRTIDDEKFEQLLESTKHDRLELNERVSRLQIHIEYLQEENRSKSTEVGELEGKITEITSESEEKSEEIKKQKGRAASAHTTKGQILEKWCPFLEHPEIDPDWEAKNWSFMGQPIDYIIFDWRENKEINVVDGKVIMLDVKSGKSQLTTKQRRIRDLIQAGRVEWRTIRLE